jgi:hypothetical protein
MVDQWRAALRTGNLTRVEPTLASDVRFGSCVGQSQVVDYLGRMLRQIAVVSVDIEALPDRLIATLESKEAGTDVPLPEQRCHIVIGFVNDNRLVELQVAANHDEARKAVVSPEPPPRPERPT